MHPEKKYETFWKRKKNEIRLARNMFKTRGKLVDKKSNWSLIECYQSWTNKQQCCRYGVFVAEIIVEHRADGHDNPGKSILGSWKFVTWDLGGKYKDTFYFVVFCNNKGSIAQTLDLVAKFSLQADL